MTKRSPPRGMILRKIEKHFTGINPFRNDTETVFRGVWPTRSARKCRLRHENFPRNGNRTCSDERVLRCSFLGEYAYIPAHFGVHCDFEVTIGVIRSSNIFWEQEDQTIEIKNSGEAPVETFDRDMLP